jgi:hypothetical protein
MQVRCQNCGARFSVPVGQPREINCPKCGALLMAPLPGAPVEPEALPRFGRGHASLKRVFEPIPKPLVYLAGGALALLLSAPFWIYLVSGSGSRPPLISDDSAPIPVPPPVTNGAAAAPVIDDSQSGTLTFDRFRGVRLEAGREDLQRRFNLRLRNTRGMVPEIYQVERTGDIEEMTASFYGNALKEFSMVLRERSASPEDIQKELVAQFGEPQQTEEVANTPGAWQPLAADELTSKLTGFPERRELAWADEQYRVEAKIYHTPPGIAPRAMLSVQVSAAGWLKTNQPLMGSVSAVATNVLDRPVLPAPHTFP